MIVNEYFIDTDVTFIDANVPFIVGLMGLDWVPIDLFV